MRLLLVTAVAGLVCVAVAGAAVTPPGMVIGHRIGPVKLGELKPQVVKELGRSTPARIEASPYRYRFYRKARIYVRYAKRGLSWRVAAVATPAARYTTRSGIGVGTPLRRLRKAVFVRCHPVKRWIGCAHGLSLAPGVRPQTWFRLTKAKKRVNLVLITSSRYD
jgi:hypothetical protein